MKTSRVAVAVTLHLLLVAGLTSTTAAINDFRSETWETYDVGAGPVTTLRFDARFTETDLSSGVTFSIAQRHADGTPGATLLHFVMDGFDDLWGLPPAGTPVFVTAIFSTSCDGSGRLVAREPRVILGYCHPEKGTFNNELSGVGRGSMSPSDEAQRYTLVLLDEDGAVAAEAPAYELACSDGGLEFTPSARKQTPQGPHHLAAEGGSVGIYFDEQGTQCAGTIPAGVPTRVYVLAKLSGHADCGITGAEFRFGGVPETWETFTVADENALMLGDPFGDGVSVAFSCLSPGDNLVPLFTVQVLATDTRSEFQFTIEPRNPPASPTFPRPLLTLCDAPKFSKVDATGIPCWVNASAAKDCATVAVEEHTWGGVKKLFRD